MTKTEIFSRIRNLCRELDNLEDMIAELPEEQLVQPLDSIAANSGQDTDKWLTVKQVCEFLNISQTTFYQAVKDGKLPQGLAFGPKTKRWRISDINAWQEARRDNPQEQTIPQFVEVQKRVGCGRKSKIKKHWELQRVRV